MPCTTQNKYSKQALSAEIKTRDKSPAVLNWLRRGREFLKPITSKGIVNKFNWIISVVVLGFYRSHSLSNGSSYTQTERLSPQRYRTSVSLSLASRNGSIISAESLQDRDALERGYYSGPPSPVISPYRKTPPSPTVRSYQGISETRRQHSPLANGPRAGRFSLLGENNRAIPAFQYSDSDTRSDSSTKPSSVSSYANSEDLGENPEPYGHHRRIGNSCESLDENHIRGPSPRLFVNRSAGQSSESLNSDHEGSNSPFSPMRSQRSFSFDARPSNLRLPNAKYLNTSDLAIMSTSGMAGTYSVNHNSRLSPNLSGKGYISTSLSTIDKPALLSNMNLRTAKSQVNMSAVPYLTNPGYYRTNQPSESSIFEEDLLEWRANDDSEATLV